MRNGLTLTGRGRALGATTVLLVVTGVLFGIEELLALAAAGLILLVFCVVWVRWRPWALRSARAVTPVRVAAGDHAGVELGIRNGAGRRSPVVWVRDPFDGGRHSAVFSVAPLEVGETVRASYRVPTAARGVFDIGPLRLEVTDPFGLACTTRIGAAPSTLTVHPRIVSLRSPHRTSGADQHPADADSVISQHGSDFYAVREYRTGDDLRRVHWPSTARLDELMIRQEETPAQGRLTVAVDLRPVSWADGGLEVALSAAASVSDAALADGLLVRLITTAGVNTRFGGTEQRAIILDALAEARVGTAGRGAVELGRLVDAKPGEAVVVVTSDGGAGRGTVAGFVHTPRPMLTAVMVAPERGRPTSPEPQPVRGTRIVMVNGGIDSLAEAWH
ncbi:MAG: DUF58 domain-containing protein, partial [Actinomycetota bacterium]|nr:DUF58 domain-containing protein [Actinomycetota bacterium]